MYMCNNYEIAFDFFSIVLFYAWNCDEKGKNEKVEQFFFIR